MLENLEIMIYNVLINYRPIKEEHMSTNVYDVLKERGFIEQCTHEDEVRELLGKSLLHFI